MFSPFDLDDRLAWLVRVRPSSGEDRTPWLLYALGVGVLIGALILFR
ncbi:MAG TPA: hypothetical protein VE712_02400 [Actinomycetota bacterium]|jgi:hypothetical protein|nr:hypothetical protein [Actinomycetota bacterium]